MKIRKKMFLVCTVFLFLINCGASALVHSYLYGLHAEAGYVDKNMSNGQIDALMTLYIKTAKEQGWTYIGKIGKLSNPEKEIAGRALGQYDITPGEVYTVAIENETTVLVFYIRVDSVSGNGIYNGYMSDIIKWKK